MMLLDVVIDPVTLLGDRWFLGRIYYYPDGGAYFGVTLSNFAGWFFVGAVTVLAAQLLWQRRPPAHPERSGAESKGQNVLETWLVFGVYSGVFAFNLAVTAWISEWTLFAASAAVAVVTCGACVIALRRTSPALRTERVSA
jgi:putative membrane protein